MIHLDMHWELRNGADGGRSLRMLWQSDPAMRHPSRTGKQERTQEQETGINKEFMGTEENRSRAHPFPVPYDSPRAPFVELKDSVLSQLDAVTPFLSRLMRLIATFTSDNSAHADIEVAVREALLNAVIHGNRSNPEKRVYVTCRCGIDGEISFAVRDEGTGFTGGTVEGRGIRLMRALMDEVSFADGGAIVHMKKKPTDIAPVPRVH